MAFSGGAGGDMGTCARRNRKDETAMSDFPDILYAVKDRVATITLNRPDRLNAYTARMADSIKAAMAQAADDPKVRVIVLAGAGRGFCAGADMELLSTTANAGGAGAAAPARDGDKPISSTHGPDLSSDFRDAERFGYFARTKKPIIAAINGPIAGIGLVMALYADLRFAADTAVFTTSFAQRGLIAEHGISWLLPRLVGQANALDLLLSARKIAAPEAERLGLVNKVFAADTFMDNVHAYARLLADTVSPRSMAIMKAQVWKSNFQDFNESLAVADEEMKASLKHAEFKEGVSHFLEKRPPKFADI
ncbi:MAG TPA: enoyl-CoA hydratase [Rhizomicrobium sp.]|nr:enoyl-CoA hydratase [Rhizomicrobium sp.]